MNDKFKHEAKALWSEENITAAETITAKTISVET